MRSVLLVTYYFPPAGGAGVQRTLKFTRYLPEAGWRPVVLTPHEGADFPVRDPSLAAEVPEVAEVVRTAIFEPYELYRRLTGRTGGSLDVASMNREGRTSFTERLAEWVRSSFFIPDARVGWRRPAVSAGLRAIAVHRPQAIVSSAPPYTAHLIGLDLHRRSGLPWIADFRDSWVDWHTAARRRGLPRRIELAMEGSVLREATRVITVSEGVAEDLASRHLGVRDHRWHILPNGYDPHDLDGVAGDREGIPAHRLLLTYTGTLYGPRDPETLIAAMEALHAEAHPAGRELTLRLVGRVSAPIRDRIAASPVASNVVVLDYVDHRRSIALARGSDVLLLIVDRVPQAAGILTGKLFEYLGLGRPVLALADAGEASALIAGVGAGWAVPHGDVAGMRARLIEIHTAWRTNTLRGPAPDAVAPYARPAQAQALARILEEISAPR